ncbi:MAG: phosphatase PAP2 family protein [Ignavibacteriaceae bacterium]
MKKISLLLILTILWGNSLLAQDSTSQNSAPIFKYTFSQFGRETLDFVKQPAKWNGNDWLTLALVGAGTFLVAQADQPIRTDVLKDQRYYYSAPIVAGRVYAEIYSPIVLFSGFAAFSLLTNDLGARKIAYEIGQASLYAGALSFVLKLVIGRSRPYLNQGNSFFRPFSSIFNQDNKSMPSGHSTVAFILSTVLSRNADSPILKVLAYVPAVLTMISRVYQDQHWVSDTFAGAALGYFVGTWVVDQHEQSNSPIKITSAFPLTISIALN